MSHVYRWIDMSWSHFVDGFAQCTVCHVVDISIKESQCINYVDPVIREQERKAKRVKERETKRLATIAYLNKKT